MLDVLFLTRFGSPAEVYSRINLLMKFASLDGKSCEIRDIPEKRCRRLLFFAGLCKARQVIIHDTFLTRTELVWISKRSDRIVFDCSTNFYLGQEPDFRRQCRQVGACVAAQVDIARIMNTACDQVRLVPNGVDTQRFSPRSSKDPASPLQVGALVSSGGLAAFECVVQCLRSLAGPVQFLVVSDQPYTGPCCDFVFWEKRSEQRIASQLQAMDVAVVPSVSEKRSGDTFQLLQLMACGIVPVASATGGNAEIVDHGIDGFLVDDSSEWEKYVMHLLDAPELRFSMGAAARHKAVSRFDWNLLQQRFWEPW